MSADGVARFRIPARAAPPGVAAARRRERVRAETARATQPPLLAVLMVIAVAVGCGAGPLPPASPGMVSPSADPDRTPPASAVPSAPSPSASAPATPAPTPTQDPAGNAEGYRTLTLPATGVRTVKLVSRFGGFHRMDSDGPLVVLDETGSCSFTHADGSITAESKLACRSIVLVDLAKGTFTTLQQARLGWRAWVPSISGRRVAWLEYHYRGPLDTGALAWRILLADLDTGKTRQLDAGVQHQNETSEGFGASSPALNLDGDRLAYAIEDPSRPPVGWKIVVRSVASGRVEREIPTDLPVCDVAIDGEDVAWTEGRTDPDIGFTYDTRLMLSTAAQPAPRHIAAHAYEVDFDAGRIAWNQDRPVTITGAAQHSRMWSATSPDFEPEPVSPIPQQGIERYQAWPQTGDGFVTWESFRWDETVRDSDADRFCLWNPADGLAYEVAPTRGVNSSGSDGGWFVWTDWRSDTISGIPIKELLP